MTHLCTNFVLVYIRLIYGNWWFRQCKRQYGPYTSFFLNCLETHRSQWLVSRTDFETFWYLILFSQPYTVLYFYHKDSCCSVNETEPAYSYENCSIEVFPIPPETLIYLDKLRFFKLQVDTFYGKGAGLRFLRFNGTRLGNKTFYININYIWQYSR